MAWERSSGDAGSERLRRNVMNGPQGERETSGVRWPDERKESVYVRMCIRGREVDAVVDVEDEGSIGRSTIGVGLVDVVVVVEVPASVDTSESAERTSFSGPVVKEMTSSRPRRSIWVASWALKKSRRRDLNWMYNGWEEKRGPEKCRRGRVESEGFGP